MLLIHIPSQELYDQSNNQIIQINGMNLKLEHSLISVSKWEEIWCKPFLTKNEKTNQEMESYICCMSISGDVDISTIRRIPPKEIQRIYDYIEANKTATWFSKTEERSRSREQITSELIYYSMFSYGIPKECEKWHLSRLMALIEIFQVKNAPEKKMSQSEIIARNKQLNAQRRAKTGSKG